MSICCQSSAKKKKTFKKALTTPLWTEPITLPLQTPCVPLLPVITRQSHRSLNLRYHDTWAAPFARAYNRALQFSCPASGFETSLDVCNKFLIFFVSPTLPEDSFLHYWYRWRAVACLLHNLCPLPVMASSWVSAGHCFWHRKIPAHEIHLLKTNRIHQIHLTANVQIITFSVFSSLLSKQSCH